MYRLRAYSARSISTSLERQAENERVSGALGLIRGRVFLLGNLAKPAGIFVVTLVVAGVLVACTYEVLLTVLPRMYPPTQRLLQSQSR